MLLLKSRVLILSLKEELVMLGGHLDSWHAATGATDNAAGCSVMMEAIRILKQVVFNHAVLFVLHYGAVKSKVCMAAGIM
jgi:Zn-dependent M28 family amino/carboxypeptidase